MASRESSSKSRSGKPLHSVDLPVFVISVAAELAGMHPQTLRQYDRIGLVQPSRAPGKARRYSQRDVNRLQQIQQLSQEGVSLEGIRRIIELESLVEEQQEQIAALQRQVEECEGEAGLGGARVRCRYQRRRGAYCPWYPPGASSAFFGCGVVPSASPAGYGG